MAKKCPKVQKVSKRRDFIALMLLSAPRIGDFLNNFGIIGFKMQHHKISQMSPRFLWYIMMFYLICMWRHHFGSFRSKTRHHDQKDTSSFDISGFGEYFGHHFGILRSKSRHHQRPECLLLRHLRSLMMPDFVSFFMHNFGIMRFKSRHHQRPELPRFWHLWYIMMPLFGSHDAKMMPRKIPKPQNGWKPRLSPTGALFSIWWVLDYGRQVEQFFVLHLFKILVIICKKEKKKRKLICWFYTRP